MIRVSQPLSGLALGAGLLLAAAACSSSSHQAATSATSVPPTSASSSTTSTSAGSAAGGVTIAAADVTGLGTVLVDGSGRTLYMLTSEKGGKITCTDENGCTKYWPDTELPSGVMSATAGSGIKASLLSTVKDAKGSLYVTYGGWPLYTYSGDSAAGQANGEGVNSFGGTWYALNVSGQPVTTKTQSSHSGGYGY